MSADPATTNPPTWTLAALEAALRDAMGYVDRLLAVYDAAAGLVDGTSCDTADLQTAVEAAWDDEETGELALRHLREVAGISTEP